MTVDGPSTGCGNTSQEPHASIHCPSLSRCSFTTPSRTSSATWTCGSRCGRAVSPPTHSTWMHRCDWSRGLIVTDECPSDLPSRRQDPRRSDEDTARHRRTAPPRLAPRLELQPQPAPKLSVLIIGTLTSADWVQATRIMMLDWLELEEVSVRVF